MPNFESVKRRVEEERSERVEVQGVCALKPHRDTFAVAIRDTCLPATSPTRHSSIFRVGMIALTIETF